MPDLTGTRSPLRLRDVLLACYALLCVGALTWPGYAWLGNSIEPRVLGLPFSLIWVVLWVLASFVATLLHYLATERARA